MKILILVAIIWVVYAYRRENGWEGLKPFESDDCSGGMSWAYKKMTGKRVPWASACVEHDRAYHKGGSKAERYEADKWLMTCVSAEGYPWWAMAMFIAVRIGGVSWLPTSYRWGFGRAYKLPWKA